MELYNCLLFLSYFISSSLALQDNDDRLPVRISPTVVKVQGNDICPEFNSNIAEIRSTEEEIKEALANTVNPLLNFGYTCGGPGWTKVAYLNMTDPSETCPFNLSLVSSPVRGCGQNQRINEQCDSVIYRLYGRSYSRVCGQILAYQKGYPEAFQRFGDSASIDTNYVDGISLTHGPAGSREHIWTFVEASYDQNPSTSLICSCSNTSNSWPHQVPPFVGNNYFCDTGNHNMRFSQSMFYTDDPLWDGQGCGPSSSCCDFNSPPWFNRVLPRVTSDDIEMRLCFTLDHSDEDAIIYFLDIYVQ